MPVRDLLENIHAEPLPEFHHAFLMAGGAEVAALAGKRQQVFMAAVFACHAGKAMLQISAVKITIDYLFDIGPPKAILSGKVFVVGLNEGFKVILDVMVINFCGRK